MPEKGNLLLHYLSAFAGAASSLAFSEWVSLGFLFVALTTLITNIVYKEKNYQLNKRATNEHSHKDQ